MAGSKINIDYDRGVLKKGHPDGINIYMYKDEPGTYRNAYGSVVTEELAAGAGYDVKTLGKQRMFLERLEQSKKLIADELAMGEQNRTVVLEREGFQIVDIGMERHWVEDPDGNRLTQSPLPLKAAKALLLGLVPEKPKETKAPEPAPEEKESGETSKPDKVTPPKKK